VIRGRRTTVQERLLLLTMLTVLVVTGVILFVSRDNDGAETAIAASPVSIDDVVIVVPSFSDGPVAIDINTASAEELTELHGIGPVLAARIVEYREQHGPFASIDDLASVQGIGAATVDGLRERASVGQTD